MRVRDASPAEVAHRIGLDDDERDALVLLTRRHRETLSQYIARIVGVPRGVGRELARVIKLANVEDRAHWSDPSPARYRQALERLVGASEIGDAWRRATGRVIPEAGALFVASAPIVVTAGRRRQPCCDESIA